MSALLRTIRKIIGMLTDRSLRFRIHYARVRAFFFYDRRYYLADKFLKGDGIEIGALHLPLAVPAKARVKYVDRLPLAELRAQYPELKRYPLVVPDIIDDGEKLAGVVTGSQDFVIANHFLEHCEDPVRAIENFLRVVRDGGMIYLAVPDKRYTFDNRRAITPLEHVLADYREGPGRSREEHFRQWRSLVDEKFGNDKDRRPNQMKSESYSIHYHVWTYLEVLELLAHLKKELHFSLEIEEMVRGGNEAIFMLRKGSSAGQ